MYIIAFTYVHILRSKKFNDRVQKTLGPKVTNGINIFISFLYSFILILRLTSIFHYQVHLEIIGTCIRFGLPLRPCSYGHLPLNPIKK